jgi:hypothetical protein
VVESSEFKILVAASDEIKAMQIQNVAKLAITLSSVPILYVDTVNVNKRGVILPQIGAEENLGCENLYVVVSSIRHKILEITCNRKCTGVLLC